TTNSPYTSICSSSGFNLGLAYKTFSYVEPGFVEGVSNYSGVSYPCCVNGYVQYNPANSFVMRKIQLLLSNATPSPQTLQINFGDFGSNPVLGTASAVVPANTPTAISIDFIFNANINLVQSQSYKIQVAIDNQNIQWRGTTNSPYTSICNSSGFNLGLAYKIFSPTTGSSWVKLH
ncbi:MAG: hypothetical protein LH615_14850, partial [Ferruginibacter sp.]|nr:hypothetical protein [Ferruginibacter sp.]